MRFSTRCPRQVINTNKSPENTTHTIIYENSILKRFQDAPGMARCILFVYNRYQ